jgi:hypothetical protein
MIDRARSRARSEGVQTELYEPRSRRPKWAELDGAVQQEVIEILALLVLAKATDEREHGDG